MTPLALAEPARQAAARHAIRGAVLPVAVKIVGHACVGRHVVHLRDREHDAGPVLAARERDARSTVVRDHHAVGIRRIDPDVVVVPAGLEARAPERLAAVARHAEPHRDEVEPLLVVGGDREAHVVRRALGHVVVARHHAPIVAAVVAAVQRGIPILDECVDRIGVGRRDRHGDLAEHTLRVGEATTSEALPRDSAVVRRPQPAARPAALQVPRLHLELPHPGEQRVGVAGIDGEVRAAGVRVDEQDAGPGPAAVRSAVHAALLRGAVGAAQRAHEHDVGIRGMDHDAGDSPRRIEAHVQPASPAVRRPVDAVAQRRRRPDEERLARSRPQDVVRRGGDGERADRLCRFAVEHRTPVHAAILGLPDAARRGADISDERVAGFAHRCNGTVAFGPDEAVMQPRPQRRIHLLGGGAANGGCRNEQREESLHGFPFLI